MSDNKVTLDQLDNSAIEAMTASVGDVSTLNTENKTIVGALAEIVGKKEIANAIGEPLAETDKFTEMSSEINGLLSTFKTNMMNAGVVVESGDKFKALIDKIKGLTEGEGNKGIKFVEGVSTISGNTISHNCGFTPTYFFVQGAMTYNMLAAGGGTYTFASNTTISNISGFDFRRVDSGLDTHYATASLSNLNENTVNVSGLTGNVVWYAIGVGEEDTTLRDSLASILEEKGVDVTEEDDMSSLITKVDEEFDNMRQEILTALSNKGIEVENDISFNELLDTAIYQTLPLESGTGPYMKDIINVNGTFNSKKELEVDYIIDYNEFKFSLNGVNVSFGRGQTGQIMIHLRLYHMRDGEIIGTIYSYDRQNYSQLPSFETTAYGIKKGDVIRLHIYNNEGYIDSIDTSYYLKLTSQIII